MKINRVYSIVWLFMGLLLLVIELRLGVIWIVSGFLSDMQKTQYKKDYRLRSRKIPSYIR